MMETQLRSRLLLRWTPSALTMLALAATPIAAEWTHWRGPHQTGVSDATGLVSTWSKDGENLAWRHDFTGRSTPVVFDGRVCANGRRGEGIHRVATVACWDAASGDPLWQKDMVIRLTDVPWNRVGWANPAADPETGYLYVLTVDGSLQAFDRDGTVVWRWNTSEDLGHLSGYGGRTFSPIVEGDLVIQSAITAGWGAHKPPRHRYYAFDKRTGDIVYVANPGGAPAGDLNIQTVPVVVDDAEGRRLLVSGNVDGSVHAMLASTGESVWSFPLSQRGLNSSVVVGDGIVVASHSEENVHETGTMGRIVALDLETGELQWDLTGVGAGFPSALIHDGTVYVADNSANLTALDLASGEKRWSYHYGTVGKSSPVYADGKIYLTEVNGNVEIVDVSGPEPKKLDHEHLEMPPDSNGVTRYAEVYGSVAIGYGRVYFTTEEGVYALGAKGDPIAATARTGAPESMAKAGEGAPASLQVVPGEIVAHDPKDPIPLEVRAFDGKGRPVAAPDVSWSLKGLTGAIEGDRLQLDAAAGTQVGMVVATAGELSASARVRAVGALPYSFDFEAIEVGQLPSSWLPAFKGAQVAETEDGRVVEQPKASRGAPRSLMYLGGSRMSGYTIQADVQGVKQGRRFSDLGLVNSGYILDLMGGHQRLQVRSWPSERRMMQQKDFAWELGAWYTMKMRVDIVAADDGSDKAVIRGKVWKRGENEPADWSITVEDPVPVKQGSPGLYTFAPVESYFDNVKVMVND